MERSDDLEHRYSPSRWAPVPMAEHLARYRQLSARHVGADLTRRGRPLLVYVHGGYWQELSVADSLFMADDAEREGIGIHAVEYTLAPAATVAAIVEECVVDVERVLDEASPPRVVLAGSSAGAHLVSLVRADPRVSGRIDGSVLLSGVYDLRPLLATSVNDALGLDDLSARAVSPLLLGIVAGRDRVLCAVAEHDPPDFVAQNRAYADRLEDGGVAVDCVVVPDRDHFDLPLDILSRGTTVGDWTLGMLTGGTP